MNQLKSMECRVIFMSVVIDVSFWRSHFGFWDERFSGGKRDVLEQKMEADPVVPSCSAQQQSCSSTVAYLLAVWTNLVG